jgi:hypothetical protein
VKDNLHGLWNVCNLQARNEKEREKERERETDHTIIFLRGFGLIHNEEDRYNNEDVMYYFMD